MSSAPKIPQYLSQVSAKRKGRIVGFATIEYQDERHESEHSFMIKRLRDMGFEENSLFEVMHVGPIGGDPLAVKIEGMIVALRRSEAALIHVEIEDV